MARPSKARKALQIAAGTIGGFLLFITAFAGFAYVFVTSDIVRAHKERHAATIVRAQPAPSPQIASSR